MSGFQQDLNQLQPNFYRVTLALTGGTGTYPTANGNDNGAVYTQDHSQFTTLPTTIANARRVARGHLRFFSIIEEVKKFADAQIINVGFTSAGATAADNQPTQVTFTIRYDRDANVLESLKGTNDTAGAAIDTVVKAVRQLVVQGVCRGGTTGYTRRVRVYDPVQAAEVDEFITIVQPDVPADVYADTTVILVPATTLLPA
jgi:hypothetical protein